MVTSEALADDRRSGVYVGKLHTSDSGAAGDSDSVEVVVKFTAEYYNADAHRILAQAGFAPALHACVPVCGGLKMVVMDRVQGENAWSAEQRDGAPAHGL